MREVSSGTGRPRRSERAAWPGTGHSGLPKPLTSFIGRERELAEAKRLLQESYLVTLTGPGGSGKTRLCIAVAAEVATDYPDGVYFVPLAPVRDPGLVPSTIAQGIGLQDARDRPLMEHLLSQLRRRQMLLVLDNFEHLLPGAAVVTELLSATTALRILVSSRSALHVSGEQECPVPPLAVPDKQVRPTPESLAACESVHLFAQRAAAAVPGFTITGQNAPAVAEIARRLDGLPLAIELAAARVKLLPPEAILPRLEQSLGLLTSGRRDLPDRQQTLRGTIAWSYDLLNNDARRLLAACSAFAGGASLEAIETVCGSGMDSVRPVLDGVAELVDQNLLRQVRSPAPSMPRYAMLETVREYASERLDQLPEADQIRGAHAAFLLALVEAGRPRTGGLATKEWLDRVDVEHNNIRAALAWHREHDPPAALRLAASMAAFWSLRGHHSEGRQRLAELLAQVPGSSAIRVSALNGAGWLALDQGDYASASGLFAESIKLARAMGDVLGEGIATVYLGRCRLSSMHIAEAVPDIQRAAALVSQAGDRPAIALTTFYSALAALLTDRPEKACELFSRCASDAAGLGLEPLTARARAMLSYPLLDLGDITAARAALSEGIPLAADVGDRWFVQIGLGACIGLAALTGRPRLAFRVAGAAEAYRDANQFSMPVPIAETIDRWLGQARAGAEAAADRLVAEGRRLTPDAAVELALADDPHEARRPQGRRMLTPRETEVAVMVASGLTNREIAARLFLSVRTVEVHVDHILTKLAFHTRTQLAAWAHEEGLPRESAENT